MHSSSNQHLVGSIQQYANNLYLNQAAVNLGMSTQMIPKLRTINRACKYIFNLMDFIINVILFKEAIFECYSRI